MRDVEVSLPPLPTQRKIAAVLGALDDKIENNRKICANLEAQAQAIFKSWFVDFEPLWQNLCDKPSLQMKWWKSLNTIAYLLTTKYIIQHTITPTI